METARETAGLLEWTVLLLYPDYLAEQYGEETYLAWVNATDPEGAIKLAQAEAAMDQCVGYRIDPEDFLPLLVIEGNHEDHGARVRTHWREV